MNCDVLKEYHPEIPPQAWEKLGQFCSLVAGWNEKINTVSRKDIEHLPEKHLAPSLALAKIAEFNAGAAVLDVGTGGGFPGIPLAILFPDTQFTLIDSVNKKLIVVDDIVEQMKLSNVTTLQIRAEEYKPKFDYVVGRAVTALPRFVSWIEKNIRKGQAGALENGILYLKGGDFAQELEELNSFKATVYPLGDLYINQFCEDKSLVHLVP